MGLIDRYRYRREINNYLKDYETLSLIGDDKKALRIVDMALQKYPEDLSLIYANLKGLIKKMDLKNLDILFEKIKKLPTEIIKNSGLRKVIPTDLLIKNERDLHDRNIDPLISNEELNKRETISNFKDYIEMVVRRSFYMCVKFNGRRTRGEVIVYSPKQIKFLAELNIRYCPKDKEWVLLWFYKEGMYAVERKQYKYALDILNEYIDITQDNRDDMAHNKFYSRGLAYFNLKDFKEAVKDFETSLKFTKEKELIIEVKDIINESKRRLKSKNPK